MKLLYFLPCIAYANSFYMSFGPSRKEKIIGGKIVNITEVPYQASFEYFDKHRCGATIISDLWLVSAAHCFYTKKELQENGKIRVGTSFNERKGELFNIKRVILHPEYNDKKTDNDIALVQLTTPIEFNEYQKPISIVKSNEIPRAGQKMKISDFGRPTLDEDDHFSVFLKAVIVKVVDDSKCASAYRYLDPITDNMLCAESSPYDACTGDSGGPGIINGKLAGVISNGYDCATGIYPGIYTKVYKYYDWIIEETNFSL